MHMLQVMRDDKKETLSYRVPSDWYELVGKFTTANRLKEYSHVARWIFESGLAALLRDGELKEPIPVVLPPDWEEKLLPKGKAATEGGKKENRRRA